MEDANLSESHYTSDVIEDPLVVVYGEGSGSELLVGNEEKQQMFFFGTPGCLKNSPIRPSANPTSINQKPDSNPENTTSDETPPLEKTNDDDENDLLKRISQALNDNNSSSQDTNHKPVEADNGEY